jgi:FkbM family methyltransferase
MVVHDRFQCVKGIAVEANPSLFDSIHQVAERYLNGVDILPSAAWSKKTRLQFKEVRGGMIQVTESLEGELNAAPIDDYLRERIDCIKMDIEGAESEALSGCKQTVSVSRPDLAIAAYHRPEDLVTLPAQLQDMGYDQAFCGILVTTATA